MKKLLQRPSFWLTLILLFAGFFRLYQLSTLPISLFGDEVDVGYQAWSLLTTGRDYMGHLLPTYIQSLSEWRAPLLMYVVAPLVGVFGPTTLGVRLAPALLGIFDVYLVYFFTKLLFKKETPAVLSALFLALSPWHIHFSRATFEVTLLLALLLGGSICYLKKKFGLSFILFALTFYTYSTANIITPLLCLTFLFLFPLNLKTFWRSAWPAIILVLPIIYHITFGQAAGRFSLISIFDDPKVAEEVIIKRTEPWVKPNLVENVFHNKYTVILSHFGQNYLTSFSPQFLFMTGDPRFRHSPGNFGELLWPMAIFLVLGLYLLLATFKEANSKLIIAWLLLSPLAGALTIQGGNHATRLFVMLPPLVITCGLGASHFFTQMATQAVWKRLVMAIMFLGLFIFSFASYWHYYSAHYKYLSSKEWNYGYQEIFTLLKPIQSSYKNIFINNTYQPSLLLYSFYTSLPPRDFQKMFHGDEVVDGVYPEFNGFRFGDHLYFGEAISPLVIDHITKDDGLYLSAQGREAPGNWNWIVDSPGGTKPLGGVYDVFGNPLFHLITHFQNQ